MTHPLANIAFLIAGAIGIAAFAATLSAYWPKIRRAMTKGG